MRNYSKLLSKISNPFKIIPILPQAIKWAMLLRLLMSLDKITGGNLAKASIKLFWNNIKNNMDLLKTPSYKIPKEGLASSKEKCKILMINSVKSFQ